MNNLLLQHAANNLLQTSLIETRIFFHWHESVWRLTMVQLIYMGFGCASLLQAVYWLHLDTSWGSVQFVHFYLFCNSNIRCSTYLSHVIFKVKHWNTHTQNKTTYEYLWLLCVLCPLNLNWEKAIIYSSLASLGWENMFHLQRSMDIFWTIT